MSNYSVNIKINKLHNIRDIEARFDNDINILVGENGCGKSTVSKIISFIINNDFISLSKILFESIELIIDGESNIINYSDLLIMKEAKYPEFRFIVREALLNNKNFNDYYRYIKEKIKKISENTISNYDENYYYDYERYIIDDIEYYQLQELTLTEYTANVSICPFGSLLYLKNIYNLFNNKFNKLISFSKVDKAKYYNFVELDENYYVFNKINLLNKIKYQKLLNTFLNNKKIKFINNQVAVYNIKNKRILDSEQLSSGEKKIIQLFKALSEIKKDTILILDEPELSLSFEWRNKMLELLKKEAKKCKIICISQQMYITKETDLNLIIPLMSR